MGVLALVGAALTLRWGAAPYRPRDAGDSRPTSVAPTSVTDGDSRLGR